MAKFYITNAIPYVNAKPHVGHALEFVQSDVIARFHKNLDEDVLLLCGGDENAIKNVQAAEKNNTPIQDFVDTHTNFFLELSQKLNVSFDVFQKGSDQNHILACQKLWNLCVDADDIYKKEYSGLYCVGCELFYEKNELNENGQCLEHPGKRLETVTEENYFFKLSRYEEKIKELIGKNILKIIPDSRRNEMLAFLSLGLKDISISRSNERAKNWGVPVPSDATQRMYVWFDALNIYQSGVGFGSEDETYKKWWPADVHVIGKGITRFHAIYWPAFLLSAGLELPKSLFVHGYFTVNGQKMSKTLGNVVDPMDVINKFGTDAFRYYLLREIPSTSDGDFSLEKLQEVYNADLANGLGNLVARVAKLCETNKVSIDFTEKRANKLSADVAEKLKEYKFNEALEIIWGAIRLLDQYINRERPWQQELSAANQTLSNIVIGSESLTSLLEIAQALTPFLPETAEKILQQFKEPKIVSQPSLFPRIS